MTPASPPLSMTALSLQGLMAAAVVLEHMVRREWLKPYWRLWAFPAPSPDETGAPLCHIRPARHPGFLHCSPFI